MQYCLLHKVYSRVVIAITIAIMSQDEVTNTTSTVISYDMGTTFEGYVLLVL